MCGKDATLNRYKVEGTIVNLCDACERHGEKIEEQPTIQRRNFTKREESEIIQIIRKDWPLIVKNAREKTGMKQKEMAQKIAEKESVIHNIESGHMKPSISLARKLEKFLHINLVESYKEEGFKAKEHGESAGMTLGDMIKIKKR